MEEIVEVADLVFRLGDMVGTIFFGYLIWKLANKLTDAHIDD
jgi:hypothetical protein